MSGYCKNCGEQVCCCGDIAADLIDELRQSVSDLEIQVADLTEDLCETKRERDAAWSVNPTNSERLLIEQLTEAQQELAELKEKRGTEIDPMPLPDMPPGIVIHERLGNLYDRLQVQSYAMGYLLKHDLLHLNEIRAKAFEDAAGMCDEFASDKFDQYKGRGNHPANNPNRADQLTQGESIGAEILAESLRAEAKKLCEATKLRDGV